VTSDGGTTTGGTSGGDTTGGTTGGTTTGGTTGGTTTTTDPTDGTTTPTDPTDPTGGSGGTTATTDPGDTIDFPNDPTDPTNPTSGINDPIEPIDFSGVVFNDRDGDSVRDSNEVGIAGRTVFADANDNGALDAGEVSAVTDAGGHYDLQVNPGSYTLRQIVPNGWYQTLGGSGLRRTAGTSDVDGLAFGETKYASIAGAVFRDRNRNGKRDAGEAGIAGWTVYIDSNNNGWRDANERSVKTDANGKWRFGNLKPGVYNVRVCQKDKSLHRTTASYRKHTLFSGSSITNDLFGYA